MARWLRGLRRARRRRHRVGTERAHGRGHAGPRGLGVRVYEAADYIGGAAHTEELTLPGFRHDVGSAVHPLGVGSPAFKVLGLEQHGLEWIHGDIAMAHPLPDGTAATLTRSVEETMASLDGGGRRYRRFVKPFLGRWDDLAGDFLRPVLASFPRHRCCSPGSGCAPCSR